MRWHSDASGACMGMSGSFRKLRLRPHPNFVRHAIHSAFHFNLQRQDRLRVEGTMAKDVTVDFI